MADWRSEFTAELPDGPLMCVSFPGVFAHGRMDEGTRRLIEALPTVGLEQRVLDFGCGCGIIAAVVRRRSPGARIDLLDVDALALEAARHNVPRARAMLGDGWDAVGSCCYDLIVSNPPIHRGKSQGYQMVRALIEQAPRHLSPRGLLLLVAQRTVPIRRMMAASFSTVQVVSEDAQFRVWRSQR